MTLTGVRNSCTQHLQSILLRLVGPQQARPQVAFLLGGGVFGLGFYQRP